jgi:hypothetical protein
MMAHNDEAGGSDGAGGEGGKGGGRGRLELAALPQLVPRLRAHQVWLPGTLGHASIQRLEDQRRRLPCPVATLRKGNGAAH